MEISERLKLSDGRDHEQILQAAVKKRDFQITNWGNAFKLCREQ